MRCFLVLLILFLASCNYSHNDNLQKRLPINSSIEKTRVCNYEKQEKFCHDLYVGYKGHPTEEFERKLLFSIRDSLLPCWYGTPWDFYGTTEKPGEGKIACGYFVTTVLRDIGIPLQRVKLAQCASEEMIKAICIHRSINRYSNVGIEKFVDKIKESPIGLYVVGLDNHTGFILNDGQEIYFIHSTYVGKRAVMCERAKESIVLASSKYRVIGKVTL